MAARKTTVFLMLILIAIGTFTFISIPKDAEPDIDVPFVYVSVVLPGISPEDSERLIVRPLETCLLYTSPSPRDQRGSRMPSSA